MPSYEFVCQECGAPFEARMSMAAYETGEGRRCPTCGSSRVERAYTAVNVIAGGRSGSGGGGSCACGSGSGFS